MPTFILIHWLIICQEINKNRNHVPHEKVTYLDEINKNIHVALIGKNLLLASIFLCIIATVTGNLFNGKILALPSLLLSFISITTALLAIKDEQSDLIGYTDKLLVYIILQFIPIINLISIFILYLRIEKFLRQCQQT